MEEHVNMAERDPSPITNTTDAIYKGGSNLQGAPLTGPTINKVYYEYRGKAANRGIMDKNKALYVVW